MKKAKSARTFMPLAGAVLVVICFFILPAGIALATFTDCATSWSNFVNSPGYTADYTYKGQPIRDYEAEGSGDPSRGSANVPPAETDLASYASPGTNPGAQTTPFFGYYDGGTPYNPSDPATLEDDYIFFRMRVNGDPRSNGPDFKSYHWNVLFDVDGDGYKEYWVDLEGSCTQQVCGGNYDRLNILYSNLNNQQIADPDAAGVRVQYFQARNAVDSANCGGRGYSHTRTYSVGDGSPDWYIEMQVPMTAFNDSNGNQVLFPDSPVAFVYSTGASNQDPLQKDHMMDLNFLTSADPITFGDIVIPNGEPQIEFANNNLDFVSFYTTSDTIYLFAVDRFANDDANTREQISVTVTNPATGDDETVYLYETGPNTGIFTNTGCSAPNCTTISAVASDGTMNNSDNSGTMEVSAGDRLTVSYTSAQSVTVNDTADIVGACEPYLHFTRANGFPTDSFQLTTSRTTSDKVYVTVTHPASNSNPATVQTIAVSLSGTSGDQQTLTLTETGPNTGIFRNTTGLDTEVAVAPIGLNDGLWEDSDGGNVTATYTYNVGGCSGSKSTTADIFYTSSAGRVYFTNPSGVFDVDLYTAGQPVFVKVVDSNACVTVVGGINTVTATIVSDANDSETIRLYETSPGSFVFMNRKNDLVTNAGSAAVTSASSTFVTDGVQVGGMFVVATGPDAGTYTVATVDSQTQLTLTTALTSARTGIGFTAKPLLTATYDSGYSVNDGTIEAVNAESITVQYSDCNDGDNDNSNNVKTDVATYNVPPLVINAVLFYPDSTTCQTEYVEILNSSGSTVNATGYRITDGEGDSFSYTIPQLNGANIQLAPGEKIIVSLYSSDTQPNNQKVGSTYYFFDTSSADFPADKFGQPGAADPADQILLSNTSGTVIDYVGWSTTPNNTLAFRSQDDPAVLAAIWQDNAFKNVSGIVVGHALQRATPGLDTNSPDDWAAAASASTVCEAVITRAVVTELTACPETDGVAVEWKTSSEVGTVGFLIMRRDLGTGVVRLVTPSLLPALLRSPQGGAYRFVDREADPAYAYLYSLIEVENSGKRRVLRSVAVRPAGTEHLASDALWSPGGRAERRNPVYWYEAPDGTLVLTDGSVQSGPLQQYASSEHSPSSFTVNRLLGLWSSTDRKPSPSSGSGAVRIRIPVARTGVYFVSAAQISSLLGIPLPDVKMMIVRNNIAVSNMGVSVAYVSSREAEGILFYAKQLETVFTSENVYWLNVRQPGVRMLAAPVRGSGSQSAAETFRETLHFEENLSMAPAISHNPFEDYWLWDYVFSGDPAFGERAFTARVPGVAQTPSEAVVTVALLGATESGAPVDHHAVVLLNGSVIGEASWRGISRQNLTLPVDQRLLREGDNTVTVKGLLPAGVDFSIIYLDSVDISYERLFRADNNVLSFRTGKERAVRVSGFTQPDILVFDVTNPWSPQVVRHAKVRPDGGGYSVSFPTVGPQRKYLTTASSGVLSPDRARVDMPSSLRSRDNAADYVIITPDSLEEASRELASYRKSRGLKTAVVRLEDIMDEFNHGISNPWAIRNFLSYARSSWKTGPRFVLLAGDGTYDYKNVLGIGDNLMPTLMSDTPDGLFPADNLFVDFDGDHVPDMAVGRVPVLTNDEFRGVIEKIAAYEAAGGLSRKALFVADNPEPEANFPADSNAVASLLPSRYTANRVHLPVLSPAAARNSIRSQLQTGIDYFNYIGHGGLDRLADEGLIVTDDAELMTNTRYPVMLTLTCITGEFAYPGYDSLSEALLVKKAGGAVAVWSPTGLSDHDQAMVLNQEFVRNAFANASGTPIGSAIQKSLASPACRRTDAYIRDTYTLLGDPALMVR